MRSTNGLLLFFVAWTLAVAPALATQSHPTAWTWYAVDSPRGPTVIAGINNLRKIVGYVTTSAATVEAVAAEAPYARWVDIGYPGAAQSYAQGLSNTFIQVGYYTTTGGSVGYVRDHGVYTSFGQPQTMLNGNNNILCNGHNCGKGGGGNSHTDPLIVGAQTGSSVQIAMAFILDWTTKLTTRLLPPGGVSAMATGINGKGHVCGYLTTSAGVTESWIYENGRYSTIVFPGARSTNAAALNWQDDVVGSYVDAAGATHGFVYFFHTPWQPISLDAPGAASTIVRSINDHDDLVGSDVDSAGLTHGFLATPI